MAIIFMLLATIGFTYFNMWQAKNIGMGKNFLNREIVTFLIIYGLVIFFFINPAIVLSFRYCFSFWGKLMIPQIIYFAATIITPLAISWLIFSEMPSKGVLAGTFFAIVSVFCVLFWK